MAKANRKAKGQATFDRLLSGGKIKWWHRDAIKGIRTKCPSMKKIKQVNDEIKQDRQLVNKAIKGNAMRMFDSFITRQKRIPNWKNHEQQIQHGKDVTKSWNTPSQ